MKTQTKLTKPEPLIISASRATDIPAFHGNWFMERLRAGFLNRINPYNRRNQRIELTETRAVVFWTKNPAPFLPHLNEVFARGWECFFHFTLNDYEIEGWEPGLPPLAERIETFRRLSDKLKPGTLIWRFDPIALSPHLPATTLTNRIEKLAEKLRGYTDRLVFSFIDLYPKIIRRLNRLNLDLRPPKPDETINILQALRRLAPGPPPLALFNCAATTDYSTWGVEPSSCIDANLLARLVPELQYSPTLFAPTAGNTFPSFPAQPLKDRGQRRYCRCAPSQDIGIYDTCGYDCVYCYAKR
ncbi:MAG: hypothetical protein AMR96_00805 [Candidatus Adiutrix intracellularis]|nr:MAG: hypothetical protein AMR96_00805 [Candidatus Adiutrix intracellularis]